MLSVVPFAHNFSTQVDAGEDLGVGSLCSMPLTLCLSSLSYGIIRKVRGCLPSPMVSLKALSPGESACFRVLTAPLPSAHQNHERAFLAFPSLPGGKLRRA